MTADEDASFWQAQEAQEREQQEAWETLEWWEAHQICQSYGTQQGMTTAPDLESEYVFQTSECKTQVGSGAGEESSAF